MRNKPKVGDELWLANEGVNIRVRGRREPKLVPVTKVGRKYFTVEGDIAFHIKTWYEKTDFMSSWAIYDSKREHDNSMLRTRIYTKLELIFRAFTRPDYTTEQYKAVAEILNIDIEEKS